MNIAQRQRVLFPRLTRLPFSLPPFCFFPLFVLLLLLNDFVEGKNIYCYLGYWLFHKFLYVPRPKNIQQLWKNNKRFIPKKSSSLFTLADQFNRKGMEHRPKVLPITEGSFPWTRNCRLLIKIQHLIQQCAPNNLYPKKVKHKKVLVYFVNRSSVFLHTT